MEKTPERKIQFTYSIILIILIPILIFANFFWQTFTQRKIFNAELRQKTETTRNILTGALGSAETDSKIIQEKIDQIAKTDGHLKEITVLKPAKSGFLAVASNRPEGIGVALESSQNTNVWVNQKSDFAFITDTAQTPTQRLGQTTSVLKDSAGKKWGLLVLKIDLSDIWRQTESNSKQTLAILIVITLLILLLLINHFRFVEYAISYRRLKEVDESKDEFISVASHELKTPLAAIRGYLEMMLEGLTGKIDLVARDHLAKILSNTQRLDILVSELLDVSRLDQERMPFDLQPVDAAKIVGQIIKEVGEEAAKKKLKITQEKPPQVLPQVFADPDRLHQAIHNLTTNAIKYTNRGSITFKYQMADKKLKITVKDTGIGMSEADSRRLFEKFYRIKNEKTADIPGTGLGLWIAKEIAKRMNGEITFTSKENVGSEFSLILPIIKE